MDFLFQSSFKFIEKLGRKHGVPMSPHSQFPLLLTSHTDVVHLLQLMNQYWYIISN